MQSETSFFDGTLFKKNVTRYWPIWAAYLVIWLFIMPIYLMMSDFNGQSVFVNDVTDLMNAHPYFSVVLAVFSAMAVLSHLYSSRSANFFGSLPVRREGIFLTQYLSGLAFNWLPNIIVALLTMLVGVVKYASAGTVATVTLVWLAEGCGVYFFFYTFAFLCGMLTGHILALPVFYTVFNCIAVALYMLLETVFRRFYYGFIGFPDSVGRAVDWLTPTTKLTGLTPSAFIDYSLTDSSRLRTYGWEVLGIYMGAGLLMLVLAYLLYRRRRLESAGDVVAVRWMRPVFKYGVAVCTGLFLGYLTGDMLDGDSMYMYVSVVAWSVAGCFLAQMMLDKTFRVFKKWKGPVFTGLAMTAALCVVLFDLTGFESWLPDASELDSVEIDSFGYQLYDSGEWNGLILTTPEQMEYAVTIHKWALENRDGDGRPADEYMNYRVTYKSGLIKHERSYSIPLYKADVDKPGTASWAAEKLFEDRELYWSTYGFDRLEEYIASGGREIRFSYNYEMEKYDREETELNDPELKYGYFDDNNSIEFHSFENIRNVLDAIKEDFFAGRAGIRQVGREYTWPERCRSIDITWTEYAPLSLFDGLEGPSNTRRSEYRNIMITITPEATKTLEAIWNALPEELGAWGYDTPDSIVNN